MSKLIIILLCVLGVVIVGGVLVWQLGVFNTSKSPGCTAEAKICPDGSSVGRIAPDCEFAECPIVNETADWKTYQNKESGFQIKYPVKFQVMNQYGETYLESSSGDEKRIYISAGNSLSVMDSTSFGGRYPYAENQVLSTKVFSEQDADFQKDYFVFYGGMGSWGTMINAYQRKNGNYYILALEGIGTPVGTPSIVTGSPTKQEMIDSALDKMRDKNNEEVKIFDQILSTFKFINN